MAMTYSSLIADAPGWANDESDEFADVLPTLLERAQDRCSDAFAELEQFKTSVSGTLTAGSASLARPADAIFFRSVEITVSGSIRLLERRDVTVLKEMYPTNTAQAAPKYYGESGPSNLRVAPTPDQAYSYTIWYARKLPYLSGSITSNWLTDYAPNALQYALMVEAFGWKDYPDEVRMWLGYFGRAVNDIRKRHGLNERDDYRALYSGFSIDNQGDFPVPMGVRARSAAPQDGGS